MQKKRRYTPTFTYVKMIVNKKKKHANCLMGVLLVKWHQIDMHDGKLYSNDDKKNFECILTVYAHRADHGCT